MPASLLVLAVIGAAVSTFAVEADLLNASSSKPISQRVSSMARKGAEQPKESEQAAADKGAEKKEQESGAQADDDGEEKGGEKDEEPVGTDKEGKDDSEDGKAEDASDVKEAEEAEGSRAENAEAVDKAGDEGRQASAPQQTKGGKRKEAEGGAQDEPQSEQTDDEAATGTTDSSEEKGPSSRSSSQSASSSSLSAAEAAHLAAFYSAPRDEHPSVPNLRILTANRIDTVLASSPPFLLYLYDPTCAACALYTPVVHTLAYALDDREEDDDASERKEADPEPEAAQASRPRRESSSSSSSSSSPRVYMMNDATDHKPGFLTAEEEGALPLLKFFPQSSSASSTSSPSPFAYTASPRVSALLSFLHQQTGGAFDLARAQRRARSRLPALRRELQQRGRERLQKSDDWLLFLGSPCGEQIGEYSLAELLNRYCDSEEEGEGEREAGDKYANFVQCMREKEDESIEYFDTMQNIAHETLQQMRSRRRRQQSGDTAHEEEDDEEEEADDWAGQQ